MSPSRRRVCVILVLWVIGGPRRGSDARENEEEEEKEQGDKEEEEEEFLGPSGHWEEHREEVMQERMIKLRSFFLLCHSVFLPALRLGALPL